MNRNEFSMKWYVRALVIMVTFASIFLSCENELPETYDLSGNLTINASLNVNAEVNTIWLSLTHWKRPELVDNGMIYIYVNNKLKEKVTKAENYLYLYEYNEKLATPYVVTTKFVPGDHVRIEVSTTDGKYHAWAETIVPYPIPIERIDTFSYYDATPNFPWAYRIRSLLRLKVGFTDPSDENFYRIFATRSIQVHCIHPELDSVYFVEDNLAMVIKDDIALTDGYPPVLDDDGLVSHPLNRSAVFDDTRFNGSVYTLMTGVDLSYGDDRLRPPDYYISVFDEFLTLDVLKIELKITLQSISKIEFDYLKAYNLMRSTEYDEYSLPVKFPSNIHGGTGVFSIKSESDVVLKILED